MKKNFFISILLLSGIIFTYSCGDESSSDSKSETDKASVSVCDAVIKDGGIFRGYSFTESINDVKAKEDVSALTESAEDYLYYEYKIDDNNSYEADFSFDDEGLYQIALTTQFTKENAEKLLKKLKEKFSPECTNIIDDNELLTMDSKDGKYFVDIDYFKINDGEIYIKIESAITE